MAAPPGEERFLAEWNSCHHDTRKHPAAARGNGQNAHVIIAPMEQALFDILKQLETCERLDERELTRVINRNNKRLLEQAKRNGEASRGQNGAGTDPRPSPAGSEDGQGAGTAAAEGEPNPQPTASSNKPGVSSTARPLSKRRLMAYYLDVRQNQPERWAAWGFTPELQRRLERTLQMKPRRTASGVATITVLTKPWKCGSECLYCPNDLRMPKSYLADEPACQRAERCCFDPYLQVQARLKALTEMGHITDKVELIVLGGTWSDYPTSYQVWFIRELFRALNDGMAGQANVVGIRQRYRQAGISSDPAELAAQVSAVQDQVHRGCSTYNQAFDRFYGAHAGWQKAARWQTAAWNELEAEHRTNEQAAHRVVGLVVETRPERISPGHLLTLRRLGCTKVQMGIQSLNADVRLANNRHTTDAQIQRAFELLRLFGFKTHVHAMVNLLGSTPEADKEDYRHLATQTAFQPDEVKLYPCVLVEGTELCSRFADGSWKPYREEQLVDVLVADTCATPRFCRISRMIRDICAPDIVAGNKKVNLRQMVESRIDSQGLATAEIRHREVSLADVSTGKLELRITPYETTATSERFLEWVTPEGKIAGFLRLSLPKQDSMAELLNELGAEAIARKTQQGAAAGTPVNGDAATGEDPAAPFALGEAMIREVHVYGRVERLSHEGKSNAQHRGLGTQLVSRACELAAEAGFKRINVISAVGTRGYYRKLGFYDNGLYQQRNLD